MRIGRSSCIAVRALFGVVIVCGTSLPRTALGQTLNAVNTLLPPSEGEIAKIGGENASSSEEATSDSGECEADQAVNAQDAANQVPLPNPAGHWRMVNLLNNELESYSDASVIPLPALISSIMPLPAALCPSPVFMLNGTTFARDRIDATHNGIQRWSAIVTFEMRIRDNGIRQWRNGTGTFVMQREGANGQVLPGETRSYEGEVLLTSGQPDRFTVQFDNVIAVLGSNFIQHLRD